MILFEFGLLTMSAITILVECADHFFEYFSSKTVRSLE